MEKLILYLDYEDNSSNSIELPFSDDDLLLEYHFVQGVNEVYFRQMYDSCLEIGYFNTLDITKKQALYNFYVNCVKDKNIKNIRIKHIETEDRTCVENGGQEVIRTFTIKDEDMFNTSQMNLTYATSFYKDKVVNNITKDKKNGQQIIFLFNPLQNVDMGQKEWSL